MYRLAEAKHTIQGSALSRQLTYFSSLTLALAITVVAYFPGLHGGYVFDDFPNIVNSVPIHLKNLTISSLFSAATSSPSSDFYRPLASLSFALNWYLWGSDPFWMKAINLLIHLINGVLLYSVIFTLLGIKAKLDRVASDAFRQRAFFAFAVTSAWLLAPINLTAVLYVVQRMESLCQVFVLLGLLLYLRGRSKMLAGPVASGNFLALLRPCIGLSVCTVLGLLCKESAVLLPVYALMTEICIFRFQTSLGHPDRRLYLFFALVLALPLIVGMRWLLPHVLAPDAWVGRNFTLTQRLFTELRVVLWYMAMTVAPNLHQLSLYHDDILVSQNLWNPPTTVAAAFFLTALIAAAIILVRRRPLVSLGIFWFFSAHLLTGTIVPLEIAYDHRNYFASVGLLVALFSLVLGDDGIRRLAIPRFAAVAALLVCLTTVTHLRAEEWSNPLRLALAEADRHPQSSRANYAAAQMLVSLSQFRPSPLLDSALDYLRRADAAPNSSILPKQALIIIADRTGKGNSRKDSLELLAQLERFPVGEEDIAALEALTQCHIQGFCSSDIASLQQAFAIALPKARAKSRLLATYADFQSGVQKDNNKAEAALHEAITLAPSEPEYRFALAKLYIDDNQISLGQDQVAALGQLNRFGILDEKIGKLDHLIGSLQQPPKPQATSP